jgi:hypothetical protein
MKRFAHLVIALGILLALPGQAAALPGQAAPSPGKVLFSNFGMKLVDVLLVRPPMLGASLASSAFWLGTLPITFPTGVSDEALSLFVIAPWRFTVARYPGRFNSYEDGGNAFQTQPQKRSIRHGG